MVTIARRAGARGAGVLVALSLLMLHAGSAAAVNHPFGSHPQAYAAGSITPSHVSQSAQDQAVRDFYDAWKQAYLRQTCGAGRYVVFSSTQSGNLTVSEAHGYGMMIMALMAVLRWREETNVMASVTGAKRDSVGGAMWMGQED